ncbi:MAG: hypothetical protein ACLR8S_05405 [Paraprevotella clara]
MMKRLLLVTMGAASFLLSPAQQLLTDGSVPLESLYISDLSFFYDADGDGVKEYYAIGEASGETKTIVMFGVPRVLRAGERA